MNEEEIKQESKGPESFIESSGISTTLTPLISKMPNKVKQDDACPRRY